MKEKASAILMWAAAVPITANGIEALAHGAVTLFGALTALLGFLMGVCGFIWWIRRLRRQKVKLQLDEMQLAEWMRRHKARSHSVPRPDDE